MFRRSMDPNQKELQLLHLSSYLPPILHPGFNRIDVVVVHVNYSIKFEVVCTQANVCQKVKKATKKNNQYFVVVCPVQLFVLQAFFYVEGA